MDTYQQIAELAAELRAACLTKAERQATIQQLHELQHDIELDEVVKYFQELEDPRSEINRKHPLVSVVVIAVMAVLAGASGPTAIAQWARIKAEFLERVLELPNGIPCKDVFRRVLMALQPGAFQTCFVKWLQCLRAEAAAAPSRLVAGAACADLPTARACPRIRSRARSAGPAKYRHRDELDGFDPRS